MYGIDYLKGFGITLRHLWVTYWDDLRWFGKRYWNPAGIQHRRDADTQGLFTVQYPEEKLPLPEAYRVNPFLVYDEKENGERVILCTACGICAKVCPPQCIWIVRGTNPETGKPASRPDAFFIDIDICMNCGSCAEYCPFDAIKMDHIFEQAVRTRAKNIRPMEELLKPSSYYRSIQPQTAAAEADARAAKAAAKTQKA